MTELEKLIQKIKENAGKEKKAKQPKEINPKVNAFFEELRAKIEANKAKEEV